MIQILYNSREVRHEINRLFWASKGRRVAISAFVGNGAKEYLPKPRGMTLICWPKAGGTNPNALRTLKGLGVKIYFANSLHMKLYWTADHGAIISSANLSNNALGSGPLKEVGILLRSEEIDIDRVISSLRTRPMTPKELLGLDRRHKIHAAMHPFESDRRDKPKNFREWADSFSPPNWKLFQWETLGPRSSIAEEVALRKHGVSAFRWSLGVQRDAYEKGDWVLCYKISRNTLQQVSWVFADEIVRVPKSDQAYDPDAPYELVQLRPTSSYGDRPFIIDKQFRHAFQKAVVEYGVSRMEHLRSTKPPPRIMKTIRKHYV